MSAPVLGQVGLARSRNIPGYSATGYGGLGMANYRYRYRGTGICSAPTTSFDLFSVFMKLKED